jgi:4-alpha-glucanotransferase
VAKELGRLPFIGEDLGLITPDVQALRDEFHVPGTRVLQFAFDGHPDNPYLPHKLVPNTVVYTGTHDHAPTRQWYEELPEDQRRNLWNCLQQAPAASAEVAPALMEVAWQSVSALAIAPLQDLLNLGKGTRMNVPGRADGNWSWRASEDLLSSWRFEWLRDMTERAKRSAEAGIPNATLPIAG